MNKTFNRDGYYWVHSKDEIPSTPHFAVIEIGTIFIPGDERSRNCPGHGYPEHSETKINYLVFQNQEVWEIYVKMNRQRQIVPLHITPATVTTKVEVSVKV